MNTTNKDNIKNKKVLVIGFGKSGQAAARELLRVGALVTVQDSGTEDRFDPNLLTFFRDNGAVFYMGSQPEEMGDFDMIVLSPGVSPELDFIREAVDKGVEVVGELEIAYRIGKGNYVAITGTNGKTTTTTLVGEIFKRSGRNTYVVGNIGKAVISVSSESEEDDWLITETSSFQLETTKYFRPVISAILNLTPDHLNRHHTMEAYGQAKAKIFANQTESGYLIINKDDKLCYSLADTAKAKKIPFSIKEKLDLGAYLDGDTLMLADEEGVRHEICKKEDLRIIGDHNVQNVLAAAAISFFAGIDMEVITDAVKAFKGVEHRIEYSGIVDGVKYYNDSKGTNTDASITAIKAIGKDIILIAGGDAKKQEFDPLVKEFKGRVKKLILLGRDAYMIQEACDRAGFTDYIFCKDMNECVRKAHEIAEEGDSVLLSPACASWDMYDNYEQRGRHFKECVRGL